MSERTIDANRRHFSHTLPFGAQLIGQDRTRFRLWAPSVPAVSLEIYGQAPVPMDARDGGWFDVETACTAGARYRYRISPDLAVPDPASRFQPDDVHGESQVICPRDYVWQHPEWPGRPWEETVLYELHVGACGGYAGVAHKLPALKDLGVTAIELMPLNDFPGARNWGYDGVLPFAPDSSYGTPDELKALIDLAHGLGIMVFLDVVYNHFGPDGNYLHAYAEPFFKAGTHTPWGPAIDFDAPEVREFFFENVLYWLHEYRFDGLRLDAVHAINNDGWLRELAERVRSSTEKGRHVHLVLENERNTSSLLVHHFQAQWSDDAHNTLHVLLTGETESYYAAFADHPVHKLARLLGEGFVYQGEASPIHEGEPRGEPSGSLPPSAFVFFLQNHDQVGNRAFGERLRDLTDDASLRAATALMLLSPQIPMLFMDEENGSRQPFFFFTGYTGKLADAVREGRRKEFAKFAAFNDEARREEIPDPNHPLTFERSCPVFPEIYGAPMTHAGARTAQPAEDAAQWHAFYQAALAARHAEIIPGLHGARSLGARVVPLSSAAAGGVSTAINADTAAAIVARWHMNDGQTLTITVNLSAHDIGIDPAWVSDAHAEAHPHDDARSARPPCDDPTPRVVFSVPEDAATQLTLGTSPKRSCVVTLQCAPHDRLNTIGTAATSDHPAARERTA
jgi:maltooligosyltrehalose trehalohydrolase